MSRRGENIYKRRDGRWEGRYIRNRRMDGSIHYGYVYARTYKEVREKLLPLKQEINYSRSVSIEKSSVYDWLKTWLDKRKHQLKLSTFSTYQYKLQKYVLPVIGKMELAELTKSTIQNLVDTWKNEYMLSASTINSTFQILHKALSVAFKNGYLLVDICEDINLPKKKKKWIRALSQEDQARLEKIALSDSFGLPIMISLYTGLRIGEVSALSWNDIDFDNKVLYVENTYQRIQTSKKNRKTMLIMTDAKSTASQRTVPLTKKLIKLLKREKAKKVGNFLCNCNNRPMEPRLINYHFKSILKKAGLDNIHFHQLRHTFATRCMEANGDIVSISLLLGHSSAKTTMDIYVDSLDKQRRKIISDMENLVNS